MCTLVPMIAHILSTIPTFCLFTWLALHLNTSPVWGCSVECELLRCSMRHVTRECTSTCMHVRHVVQRMWRGTCDGYVDDILNPNQDAKKTLSSVKIWWSNSDLSREGCPAPCVCFGGSASFECHFSYFLKTSSKSLIHSKRLLLWKIIHNVWNVCIVTGDWLLPFLSVWSCLM